MTEVVSQEILLRDVNALELYANNARTHSADQVDRLARAIIEFGWTQPILADDQGVVAGHGRIAAAMQIYDGDGVIRLLDGTALPHGKVPVVDCSGWTPEQRRAYILADNRLAELAGWDESLLNIELDFLRDADFDLSLIGFDDVNEDGIGDGDGDDSPSMTIADKFMVPPFSVMNARDGWWQERKRQWISLGIRSELGRNAATSGYSMVGGYKNGKRTTGMQVDSDTSVFDPVLCELIYRWFSPIGGTVLDPFAGGSVRGIVASRLDREYVGHELRAEQISANREQAEDICEPAMPMPEWIEGDSRWIDRTCADVAADLVFSCPPYVDLEKYSDDPRDLSTMKYPEFLVAYRDIIAKACAKLKDDRFAVFVVGEVRRKKNEYYNFVGETIRAFMDAGLDYYNEAILVTAVGSNSLRVGRQFTASRKLGKTHQNVLVFVKGDAKKAAQACGDPMIPDVVFPDPDDDGMVTCTECGHSWIQ